MGKSEQEIVCWFIERKIGAGVQRRWLAQLDPPSSTMFGSIDLTGMGLWTDDPNDAIRFARKQDAEAIANHGLFGGLTVFATEHIFYK